jgi:hypothetical protein
MMPPEQENLNRQIEALQRYVSDLQRQRERAKTVAAQPSPAPPPRRPSRRWLLLAGLLVVLAMVGGVFVGAVAWSDDRLGGAEVGAGASSGTQAPNPTAAAPIAAAACKTAVDRANAMLAIAVQLQRVLDEYSRIMRDPSIGDLPGREVVERSAPALQASSSEAARFDQALAAYRQVVDQCQLQAP